MNILLVEDDVAFSSVLASGLAERGMRVRQAATYAEGRHQLSHGVFDVIVLDVMLPGGSGFELCREARRNAVTAPILMLTARDAVDDRVTGLEAGADDYLVKPFAFQELVARLRALARRPNALQPERITVEDLEVDLGARSVRRANTDIVLTAKEFTLLEFLLRNQGKVVDRTSISAYVWDENHDPFTNVLEVLVRRLRRKIDDPFPHKLIQTLRGAGYRFGD